MSDNFLQADNPKSCIVFLFPNNVISVLGNLETIPGIIFVQYVPIPEARIHRASIVIMPKSQ